MRFLVLSAVLSMAVASQARAGFIYEFSIAGNAATANAPIDLIAGGFVDVGVSVRATGATDINTLQTQGLAQSGVQLNFDNTITRVLNNTTDIVRGPAWSQTTGSKSVGANFARISDFANVVSFIGPVITPAYPQSGADSILIGTFRITSGGTLGTSTITTADLTSNNTTAYYNGVNGTTGTLVGLDSFTSANNDTLTINVVAVPEPSSMILLGAGIFGAAVRRLRRKQSA